MTSPKKVIHSIIIQLGFYEDRILVLIVSVPDHCLSCTLDTLFTVYLIDMTHNGI